MRTSHVIHAASEADLIYILTQHKLMTAQGQPVAGVSWVYKGPWQLASGAAMAGVCGLLMFTAEPSDEAETAARQATLDSLRKARALHEGNEPIIYPIGQGTSPQRPSDYEYIGILRDARKFSRGYKVGSHWFHSDQGSRGQQLGLMLAASANMIPAGLTWKTMSGDSVPMTAQLAQQIFAAAMQSDAAYHAVGEAARAQLAAGTLGDVHAIAWPKGFGE